MENKIIEALKNSRKVLVTMHVHPDPDAMGAALAMVLFLKSLGKDVRLYNEDACPSWLAFMPRAVLCRKVSGQERFVPDTAVILDCGDLERIGKVRGLIPAGARVINIDHHITNKLFAELNLVKKKYSSTSEILFELLKHAGCVFTKDIAILLYLGILTDTGSFGFDSTTSHTHEVIAELLKFNIPVARLYRQVYETLPREDLKAFLSAMNRLELECGERVACLMMTRKDVALFSEGFDIRDKIFGFLRAVKGLDVIVIITEADNGRVRINMRGRGVLDVARISQKFNGGGHKNASGCYISGTMSQARIKILSAIKEGLKWKG
ncbi:MAG: bifunctional oligoribonuclease/PAP phosphatase NrnA [Candidatus Omnitrophica bacterium]|nr:bifunctional oligoribonuclease/PAP phosphatase NrnA [Candidatus Omnitrophota bacterium]